MMINKFSVHSRAYNIYYYYYYYCFKDKFFFYFSIFFLLNFNHFKHRWLYVSVSCYAFLYANMRDFDGIFNFLLIYKIIQTLIIMMMIMMMIFLKWNKLNLKCKIYFNYLPLLLLVFFLVEIIFLYYFKIGNLTISSGLLTS